MAHVVSFCRANRPIGRPARYIYYSSKSLLMNISEIADYVWTHSHRFPFGLTPTWNEKLFTQPWAKARTPSLTWSSYGPGWYWFLVNMSYAEMHAVPKPSTLPQNGCDIGAISHTHGDVFGENLLCQPDTSGCVVYNGHENNISSRVRAHFTLQNNRTGAIGLKHFSLSHQAWEVRMFSTPCLNNLEDGEISRIQLLMNSKSGRCAVETAWRATFGWPVLCKE